MEALQVVKSDEEVMHLVLGHFATGVTTCEDSGRLDKGATEYAVCPGYVDAHVYHRPPLVNALRLSR